jgi:hypothetical protein
MSYRKIWEQHNGIKIPKGYEIHHIDGNHFNNDPSNLICVSIETHLEIHKNQEDWGAVQAILLRMNNKENNRDKIKKFASKAQKKRWKEGKHNFQKISKEKRSEISKEVHKSRKVAFLGIDNTIENSRNAGLKSAEKKSGFLNTESKCHGSKYVKGTYWWTNNGQRVRSNECPGPGWKRGMK